MVVDLGPTTRELLGFVRDGTGDEALAARICRACVSGLGVDGAALSLLTATEARQTLWATDPVAERLEDLQSTLDEGACIQAARTGVPVLVHDLGDPAQTALWPVFAAAVAEHTAVAALFALPLQWGAVNVGVLVLHRCVPGALGEAQRLDALTAADTAALMLLGLRTDPDNRGGGWLDHALGHRAEVHQATGMVLVQLGVSAPDALARLRAHAFVNQRLLVDVARDVVARRLVFTEDML